MKTGTDYLTHSSQFLSIQRKQQSFSVLGILKGQFKIKNVYGFQKNPIF